MPPHPVTTERGLQRCRDDALRRMRKAEWAGYIQGVLSAFAYVVFAMIGGDWIGPVLMLIIGAVVASLGFAVGRKHSALAAASLVVIVLGLAVLQLISGGRPPALIFVVILAWIYGQGFNGARELAQLRDVQLEPESAAGPLSTAGGGE